MAVTVSLYSYDAIYYRHLQLKKKEEDFRAFSALLGGSRR
jgi:hypothetical protein